MPTIFTKIIDGEIPAYKIAEDDQFYAFLDARPRAKGHTLVVPKQEIDYIFDLNEELLSKMTLFARKVAIAIKRAIECKRVGVMVIGLEVPHAHIHLIPISEERDMNVASPKLSLSEEEFESIARAIRQALD